MASEGLSERGRQCESALNQFDRELDALMHPVNREGLRLVTRNLLCGMFDYTPREALARTDMLDASRNIPTNTDLHEEPEYGPDLLRTSLVDVLAEDYLLQYGEEEFNEWIEPFLRSMLQGHTDDSTTYEHEHECMRDEDAYGHTKRFCPAVVTKRYIRGELSEGGPRPVEKSIGYFTHPREMVYLNVTMVKTLQKLGIYSPAETEDLLDKYMWWLESEDEPLSYDAELFDI